MDTILANITKKLLHVKLYVRYQVCCFGYSPRTTTHILVQKWTKHAVSWECIVFTVHHKHEFNSITCISEPKWYNSLLGQQEAHRTIQQCNMCQGLTVQLCKHYKNSTLLIQVV